MVNILISGYYGFDNIGDESILRTVINSLRARVPDCHLTVLSHNPAATRRNTAWTRWTACPCARSCARSADAIC
ncbi:MAG: hypothetical protein II420_00645 [Oscillospiraceae bacterium]|nr:hypothetical protein [Oscillospiraceae bacterium]